MPTRETLHLRVRTSVTDLLSRVFAQQRRDWHVWLIALAVGAMAFFVWIGYGRTLDPRDLGWIFHDDPFTHVMGWEQFRNAPLAQYPITKNELYGLEWSSTIVFSDSIPIAALMLRPLSALLPHPFQYLGWWILLSLVMQAYWAVRIVMLRTERLRDAAIASVFFVTTPVMLERLGVQTAVGSHWLLLWAFWLYLSARTTAMLSWALLLLLTLSVHAYLFVMVGGVWGAHLVSCRMRGLLHRRELGLAGVTLAAVLAWMHALGYFVIGDGAAGGGWRSSFDLLGFVAPSEGARFGLVPSVYDEPWDGSAYLGAGILILLLASAVRYVVPRRRSPGTESSSFHVHWTPLVLVVLAFTAFAITNYVSFANKQIASFPLPSTLQNLYETFRGANRMIWPAYYLVLVATLWLVLRVWPARVSALVLAAAAALQVVDLEGVAAAKREEVRGPGMSRLLKHPIWAVVAQRYRTLVSVPAKHRQAQWPTLAWFAARNGLGSNIAYLSRSSPEARIAGARGYLHAVITGTYEPTSVYYFPSPVLWMVAQQSMGPQDLAVIADGFHLVIPGGRLWSNESTLTPSHGVPRFGEWISFAEVDTEGLLFDGWSWRDPFGTFSVAEESWLALPVPPNERVRVSFKWLLAARGASPSVRVHLDNQVFDARFPRRNIERQHSFEVRTSSRLLDVRIEIVGKLIRSPNRRPVGVGLIAARVQRASDPIEVPAAAHGAPMLDTWIDFAADAPGRALLDRGWSWGERWGTWSDDPEPVLALPVPPGERLQISLRWLATAPPGQTQAVRVDLDDQPFDVQLVADGRDQESSFEVTSQRDWIRIALVIERPVTASDGRMLGVGLKAARVRRITDTRRP